MLNIFCPYRNRKSFFEDFKVHYRKHYPRARIYMLEQADDSLFKRGQLMNVAFNHLERLFLPTDTMLFIDVDIRLKYRIDFEELIRLHRSVVIPFNKLDLYGFKGVGNYVCLNRPTYFLSTPDGGVTLFTKDIYQQCNGFSNLYIGWGREDSDFVRRNKVVRLPNEMIHLEHERHNEWNTDAFKKNDRNFKKGTNPTQDGTKQTTGKFIMWEPAKNIFHCQISNISVVSDFAYKSML